MNKDKVNEMDNELDEDWCHYGGLPSPKAYEEDESNI